MFRDLLLSSVQDKIQSLDITKSCASTKIQTPVAIFFYFAIITTRLRKLVYIYQKTIWSILIVLLWYLSQKTLIYWVTYFNLHPYKDKSLLNLYAWSITVFLLFSKQIPPYKEVQWFQIGWSSNVCKKLTLPILKF